MRQPGRSRSILAWISSATGSFGRLMGLVKRDRRLLVPVVILLAIDLFWILYFGVSDTLYELDIDSSLHHHRELLLTTEGGIPEWCGYVQTIVVVVLLVRLARSTRQPIYASLALTYLVVVLDDAMTIHETVGAHLVGLLQIRPLWGLRPQNLGEALAWAALGALVVLLLVYGFARSSLRHRRNGLAFVLVLGILLLLAVGVDQLYHTPLSKMFFGAGMLLDMTEDGGEMIALTASCALALAVEHELTIQPD